MCWFFYFLTFVCTCSVVFAKYKLFEGWGSVTIHCRDNDDSPVDWWYLYKPPAHTYDNTESDGRNFSYITSRISGRWVRSEIPITGKTMLQATLNPLYKKTYINHMAGVVYGNKNSHNGTMANGVVMTDINGGLWLSHTVPNFPDTSRKRADFPEEELENGHMIVCLSIGVRYLNEVVQAIKQSTPSVDYHFVSDGLRFLLHKWDSKERTSQSNTVRTINISTIEGMNAIVMSKPPDDATCLYNKFARDRGIILDIYGHKTTRDLFCTKHYGLRSINSISLKDKLLEEVYYVKGNDRSRWAVSTTAHWQRKGSSEPEAWTCTSNLINDLTTSGGLMICVDRYDVWLTFDNVKVAEPICEKELSFEKRHWGHTLRFVNYVPII